MAVGIGRAALLTVAVVVLVAGLQVPTGPAARRRPPGEAEAELRCVRRGTMEMLACAAASEGARASTLAASTSAHHTVALLCYPFLSRSFCRYNLVDLLLQWV